MLDFLSDWLPRMCTSAKAEGLDGNHKDSPQGERKHERPQRRKEHVRRPMAGVNSQEVRLWGMRVPFAIGSPKNEIGLLGLPL